MDKTHRLGQSGSTSRVIKNKYTSQHFVAKYKVKEKPLFLKSRKEKVENMFNC